VKVGVVHYSNYRRDFIRDTINIACDPDGLSGIVFRCATGYRLVSNLAEKATCVHCYKKMFILTKS